MTTPPPDPAVVIADQLCDDDEPLRDALIRWLRQRPDLTADTDPEAARKAVVGAIVAELRATAAAITAPARKAA